MTERPLTHRQESALVAVAQGRATSYNTKSCPSLVQRGLVRDCGRRRLVRWEITDLGREVAGTILDGRIKRLNEGTL